MSTKIVVVKLREVIKTAVFAILGLLILGIIVYLFIPKGDNNNAKYIPGTYSSEIILHSNPVLVEVTVSKDEILGINLLNMRETQEVFYPLFERSINDIASQIIENQNTNIKSSINTSMTDNILVKAIDKALEEARK